MNTLNKLQNWFLHNLDQKLKVIIQTASLLALCFVMFNAGRVIEQDTYVKTLDKEYPLRPQAYFGGLNTKHLIHTW